MLKTDAKQFLAWLRTKGVFLCEGHSGECLPISFKRRDELLDEFEVDQNTCTCDENSSCWICDPGGG